MTTAAETAIYSAGHSVERRRHAREVRLWQLLVALAKLQGDEPLSERDEADMATFMEPGGAPERVMDNLAPERQLTRQTDGSYAKRSFLTRDEIAAAVGVIRRHLANQQRLEDAKARRDKLRPTETIGGEIRKLDVALAEQIDALLAPKRELLAELNRRRAADEDVRRWERGESDIRLDGGWAFALAKE